MQSSYLFKGEKLLSGYRGKGKGKEYVRPGKKKSGCVQTGGAVYTTKMDAVDLLSKNCFYLITCDCNVGST